jgi:hypothetical protein
MSGKNKWTTARNITAAINTPTTAEGKSTKPTR